MSKIRFWRFNCEFKKKKKNLQEPPNESKLCEISPSVWNLIGGLFSKEIEDKLQVNGKMPRGICIRRYGNSSTERQTFPNQQMRDFSDWEGIVLQKGRSSMDVGPSSENDRFDAGSVFGWKCGQKRSAQEISVSNKNPFWWIRLLNGFTFISGRPIGINMMKYCRRTRSNLSKDTRHRHKRPA